ncbi:OmpA family protein [Rhodoferax sp. UBA5149]|uniref:OmpA family protein n=1 Tax=Rhodoferax sp. UBA5149 TaxID=1947379 RepID=UPI002600CE8C|nr:OmpA family protein [Rhodoferax sp. UBA5149]
MKSMTRFVFAACAATALIPATVLAQDARNQGYLVDASSSIVVSGAGLCWHTSDWTPARAVEPCDPTIKPVAVATVPKAVEVAAAPPAAIPPPPPAPVMPLPQKMSFSADALFAFDKSVLKPEGRAMLDDLGRQLKGATYDVILVTGHADRFGSAEYNQKLSERRANAVKEYLVSKDIPVGRIQAKGMGESQPVTKAGECKGPKSAKVIACLQPDRRVDVEMQGTKQ